MFSLKRLVARGRALGTAWAAAGLVALMSSAPVSAETLMMPDRDVLAGQSEVIWGITTKPNGAATTYTIDFGDGNVTAPAPVVDRSYIAVNHTYVLAGVRTATLTVTNGADVETATVKINVFNGGTLSPFDLRNLKTNRAIQDGLRYLWTSQSNRTTFDTNVQTAWGNFPVPFTALVVEAFQNHGYRLPNSNAVPTGIYPKYAVRRGFNYILANLTVLAIGVTPAGNDPCVDVPAPVCSALYATTTNDPGYENGIALLAFAGSGALNRTVTEVAAPSVFGKTYGEILQRMVNASIWGQNDANAGAAGRGGWIYSFNSSQSDGSTNGWQLLGLLAANAAGATVPNWVRTEAVFALNGGLNTIGGTYDYRADGNPASASAPNIAKTGVGIQHMFFVGRPATDAGFIAARNWIGAGWNNQNPVAGVSQGFACNAGGGAFNKGCAYGMFNVFKGFKLYGVETLAGVNRPAGPGSIPADDWYADYVDWLVANQTSPTTTGGGFWASLGFSSQTNNEPSEAAVALLILAPTALVLPDEELFSTVGLRHGSPLTIDPQTNPVTTPPGTHTVTATTSAANGNPIAGVTVRFLVTSGPNAGATGTANTGANGQATFTYTDNGGAGTDNIRAFVGAIASNVLVKNWVLAVAKCDLDDDGDIDKVDIRRITALRGQFSPPADARADAVEDGRININDARACTLRCTRPRCLVEVPN